MIRPDPLVQQRHAVGHDAYEGRAVEPGRRLAHCERGGRRIQADGCGCTMTRLRSLPNRW